MSLQGIRLVTFDATNTLLKFRVSPWIHYTHVARQYGFKGTEQQVHQRFYENYKLVWSFYPNFGSDSIGWRTWWTHVIKRTFRQNFELAGNLDKLSEHLIDDFKTSKCWKQAEGASKLVTHLRDRNISVGIISNFDPRLHGILEEVGFDRNNFEFVLTSYAAKCMKPNPDIFSLALKECSRLDKKGEIRTEDVTAAEAMHIGDHYENDFCAARYAGWKSALILNDNILYQPMHEGSVFKTLNHFHNYLVANDINPHPLDSNRETINVIPQLDVNTNMHENQAEQQTEKASTEDETGTLTAPKMYQDYTSQGQSDTTPKMAHSCIVANQGTLANSMEMVPYGFSTNYTGSHYGMQMNNVNLQQGISPNYSSSQQPMYGYDNTTKNEGGTDEETPQKDSAVNTQTMTSYQWCPNPGNPYHHYNAAPYYGNQLDSNQNAYNGYPPGYNSTYKTK